MDNSKSATAEETGLNIIEITDFLAPELDVYARMTENQLLNRNEPEQGIFIAESPLVVGRALDAGYQPLSVLVEKKQITGEAAPVLARCKGIPVYTAEYEMLVQLTGFALTRGMLCAMRRPMLPSVEEICRSARRIAVLEHIMNPTNVGAVFRSAAALHMDAVLLTKECSNPLYRRAVRVSMGTVFQIPWTFLPEEKDWPGEGLAGLHKEGFRTVAMALSEEALSLRDPILKEAEKLAVVLGSEGEGLLPETIRGCHHTVCIPMSHGVDSLNVAAASAVAFWELGRQ